MITSLKIIRVGNSVAIILPDDVLARLDAKIGDERQWVSTKQGIEIRMKGR
jgi:antitoxin component of MazEF toxin-antitoxin module